MGARGLDPRTPIPDQGDDAACELVSLWVDAFNRVSTAMIVPYPPGIPVIMPGERFPADDSALLRYLTTSQTLDRQFPAFETEIHGIQVQADGSYLLPTLAADTDKQARERRERSSTRDDGLVLGTAHQYPR